MSLLEVENKPAATKTKPQDEFAGLTPTDCCDACADGLEEAAAAQLRLNEINDAHPRRVAKWEKSETVLEGDAEWCARQSPALVDEFRRLGAVAMGKCAITGQPGCSHPHKCGLTPNQKRHRAIVARYERAKKLLRDQGKSS